MIFLSVCNPQLRYDKLPHLDALFINAPDQFFATAKCQSCAASNQSIIQKGRIRKNQIAVNSFQQSAKQL